VLLDDQVGDLAARPLHDHMLDAPDLDPIWADDLLVAIDFHLYHRFNPFHWCVR